MVTIYASIAHRGSLHFLTDLIRSVQYYVRPSHTCVFAASDVKYENVTVFYEPERDRKGTHDILRRHLDCYRYLNTSIVRHRVNPSPQMVMIASNQRFFRPCTIEPNTFSFGVAYETLVGHIWNSKTSFGKRTYNIPISYPSMRWSEMVRMKTIDWRLYKTSFARMLTQHTPIGWRSAPIVNLPLEGSYYEFDMLQELLPWYQSFVHSVSTWNEKRLWTEDMLIPTWIAQQRFQKLHRARPPLCARIYEWTASKQDIASYLSQIRNSPYCGYKIPGTEHLQPNTSILFAQKHL